MPFPFRHLMWVHMRSIPAPGQGKPLNPNTKEH